MNQTPVLTVQNALNLVTTVVNQAVVRPLGDPYTIGISGLLFDIVDVIDMQIDNEVTDSYIEQNYSVQDHIAQKPVIITLKGYAAEKVAVFQPNALSTIFTAISGLVPLAGLAPTFNTQDSQFYAGLIQISQQAQSVVNQATSAFQLFNQASTVVTRQQSVFQFLFGLRNSNTLCVVETPWAIFQNMAILSIRPLQTGETTLISEFVVTFKQILTVASITGIINASSLTNQNNGSLSNTPAVAGGNFQQISAGPVNQANDPGTPTADNGNPFSVASVSQNIYTQQLQPY
jgi:hypothetical protein